MIREDRIEELKNRSYMVLSNLAFVFDSLGTINVYSVKSARQIATYKIIDKNTIRLINSNTSEVNRWKSMALIERNKEELIEGYTKWASMQKKG